MSSSTLPELDYLYIPGEEHNPVMESILHSRWAAVLGLAINHTLRAADVDAVAVINVPFVSAPGDAHTAPDIMVLAGMGGRNLGRYEVGRDGPAPLVCLEILSPSNSAAVIERRVRRWLGCGAGEVYVLDPERETVERVTIAEGELQFSDARGVHSAGMQASFATVSGRLVVCCPAGRTVGVDDDSWGWLADEQRRADQAELFADRETQRADEAAQRADVAMARADVAMARAEQAERELAALKAELDRK